jgi:hypothetical protein
MKESFSNNDRLAGLPIAKLPIGRTYLLSPPPALPSNYLIPIMQYYYHTYIYISYLLGYIDIIDFLKIPSNSMLRTIGVVAVVSSSGMHMVVSSSVGQW